jgi:hypothetical protein
MLVSFPIRECRRDIGQPDDFKNAELNILAFG